MISKFIIISIIFLLFCIAIGIIFSYVNKNWGYFIFCSIFGLLFFIMFYSVHCGTISLAQNYKTHQESLNSYLIIINSLDNENKTNESIKIIGNYIDNYNSSLKSILNNAQEYAPEVINEYSDYDYLEYDYVTNTVKHIKRGI